MEFDRTARVFADVAEEVAEVGDLLATALTAEDLIPLSAVFEGDAGRESEEEIIVVESVRTDVLDVAAATEVYKSATEEGVWTEQSF